MSVHAGTEALLALFLPRDCRESLLADLEEEYRVLAEARGARAARAWYLGQVVQSAGPIVRRQIAHLCAELSGHDSANALGGAGPWIGKAFVVFAAIWFAGVYMTTPLDLAVPLQPQQAVQVQSTSAIRLVDGALHPVFSIEEQSDTPPRAAEGTDLSFSAASLRLAQKPGNHFVILGVGVPVAVLGCAFLWLALSEMWLRHGSLIRERLRSGLSITSG